MSTGNMSGQPSLGGAAGSGNAAAAGGGNPAAYSGGSGAAGIQASMPAAGSAGTPPVAPPTCNMPLDACPAVSITIWQRLLEASDFGVNARLIAMGGDSVIVDMGDAHFKVARLLRPSELTGKLPTPAYTSWDFTSDPPNPVAVAEGSAAVGSAIDVFVLACNQDRSRCSVVRATTDQSQLAAWPGTELPAGFMPLGMVFDEATEPRRLCVFGNGLLCFENIWQPAIAPSPELRLNDVAIGAKWSLAVGDHGRWFKRARADSGALGPWQEQTPLLDTMLTQTSVVPGGGLITGDGRLQATLDELHDSFCGPQQGLSAFILGGSTSSYGYAVMGNGAVVVQSPDASKPSDRYCAFQQLSLPGPIIDSGIAPCQQALNPRVLTARTLFGTNVCLRVG